MSELEDLIGIYGAVDRAVQANSEPFASTVAPFLGGYVRDPRAIGWFDEFEAWTREVSENNEFAFPDFGSAIRNLAERPIDPTAGPCCRAAPAHDGGSRQRVQSSLVGGDSSIEIELALRGRRHRRLGQPSRRRGRCAGALPRRPRVRLARGLAVVDHDRRRPRAAFQLLGGARGCAAVLGIARGGSRPGIRTGPRNSRRPSRPHALHIAASDAIPQSTRSGRDVATSGAR